MLYCRKASGGGDGNVVVLGGGAGPVCGGCEAGEIAKIVDEVGLIGIAMAGGDVAPVDGAAILNGFEDAL